MDFDQTQAIFLDDYCEDTDEGISASQRKPVAHLKVLCQKGFPETKFPIYEGDNVIGRQQDVCSIYVPIKALSKEHACVEVHSGSHLLYDKESRNKTKRGKLYLSPGVRYELKNNDELTFADVRCVYLLESTPADASSETGSETGSESLYQTVLADNNNLTIKTPATTQARPALQESKQDSEADSDDDDDADSDGSEDLLQPTQPYDKKSVANSMSSEAVTLVFAHESDQSDDDNDHDEHCSKAKAAKSDTVLVLDTPAVPRRKPRVDISGGSKGDRSGSETDNEDTDSPLGFQQTLVVYEDEVGEADGKENLDILGAPTQAYAIDSDAEEAAEHDLFMAPTQAMLADSDEDEARRARSRRSMDSTLFEAATQAYHTAIEDSFDATVRIDTDIPESPGITPVAEQGQSPKTPSGSQGSLAATQSFDLSSKRSEPNSQTSTQTFRTCSSGTSFTDDKDLHGQRQHGTDQLFLQATLACDVSDPSHDYDSDGRKDSEQNNGEMLRSSKSQLVNQHDSDTDATQILSSSQNTAKGTNKNLNISSDSNLTQTFILESPSKINHKIDAELSDTDAPTQILDGTLSPVNRSHIRKGQMVDKASTDDSSDLAPTQVFDASADEEDIVVTCSQELPTQQLNEATHGTDSNLKTLKTGEEMNDSGDLNLEISATQPIGSKSPDRTSLGRRQSDLSAINAAETQACFDNASESVGIKKNDIDNIYVTETQAYDDEPTQVFGSKPMTPMGEEPTQVLADDSTQPMDNEPTQIFEDATQPMDDQQTQIFEEEPTQPMGDMPTQVLVDEPTQVYSEDAFYVEPQAKANIDQEAATQAYCEADCSGHEDKTTTRASDDENQSVETENNQQSPPSGQRRSGRPAVNKKQTGGPSKAAVLLTDIADTETPACGDGIASEETDLKHVDAKIPVESPSLGAPTETRGRRIRKGRKDEEVIDKPAPKRTSRRVSKIVPETTKSRRGTKADLHPPQAYNAEDKNSAQEERGEDIQPTQAYSDNASAIKADNVEDVQPTQAYSENSPIKAGSDEDMLATQAYGENLQPTQAYGEDLQPTQAYGEDLQPTQAYGEDLQPTQAYGEDRQPTQAYGDEDTPPLNSAESSELVPDSCPSDAFSPIIPLPDMSPHKSALASPKKETDQQKSSHKKVVFSYKPVTISNAQWQPELEIDSQKTDKLVGRGRGRRSIAATKTIIAEATVGRRASRRSLPAVNVESGLDKDKTDSKRLSRVSKRNSANVDQTDVDTKPSASTSTRTHVVGEDRVALESKFINGRTIKGHLSAHSANDIDLNISGFSTRPSARVRKSQTDADLSKQNTGTDVKNDVTLTNLHDKTISVGKGRGRKRKVTDEVVLGEENNDTLMNSNSLERMPTPDEAHEPGTSARASKRRLTRGKANLSQETVHSDETVHDVAPEAVEVKPTRSKAAKEKIARSVPNETVEVNVSDADKTTVVQASGRARSKQSNQQEFIPQTSNESLVNEVEGPHKDQIRAIHPSGRGRSKQPAAKQKQTDSVILNAETKRVSGRMRSKPVEPELSTVGTASEAAKNIKEQEAGIAIILPVQPAAPRPRSKQAKVKTPAVLNTSATTGGGGDAAEEATDKPRQRHQTAEVAAMSVKAVVKRGGRKRAMTADSPISVEQLSNKQRKVEANPPEARTPTRHSISNAVESGGGAQHVIGSPSLRRNSLEPKPKVLFTGVIDEHGQKIVKDLSGELVTSVFDCTHLITDKVRRTVKFLCCLSRGVPILLAKWLENCKKFNSFLDVTPYIIKDAVSEKQYKFALGRSLERAREKRLLDGYKIHITKSVKPEPNQMKDIILCAGAQYLMTMPKKHEEKTIIISCDEDKDLCKGAVTLDIPMVTSEFVLTGVLRQEIDMKSFSLFPEASGSDSGKKTQGKTTSTKPAANKRKKR